MTTPVIQGLPNQRIGNGNTTNNDLKKSTTKTLTIPAKGKIYEGDFVCLAEDAGKIVVKTITLPTEKYLGVAVFSNRHQVEEETANRARYYKEGDEVTVYLRAIAEQFILSDNLEAFDLATDKVYIDVSNADVEKRGRRITNKDEHDTIANVEISGAFFEPTNITLSAEKLATINIL